MSPLYTGSCLCGAVSVEITSKPVAVLSCFCNHCSKGAGGTNQIIAKFEHQNVCITNQDDAISTYSFTDTMSGSTKEKAFCKTCGVPLWTVPGSAKGTYLLIRTAILDNGSELCPGSEIFVRNRPPWAKPAEGAKQWDEMRK